MSNGQAKSLSVHLPTRGTRADPICVGYVPDGKVFSLISSLPASLSADDVPSLFESLIGVLRRGVTPRVRACEPYGLSLLPPSYCQVRPQASPRSPVLLHEVS